MDHCQAQHPRGMGAEFTPVGDDQNQALDNEGGKQRYYAEVPDLGAVEACDTRRPLRQNEREHDAERRQHAVGRNENCSDVEEDRMHLSQDIPSGYKEGRIRPAGP